MNNGYRQGADTMAAGGEELWNGLIDRVNDLVCGDTAVKKIHDAYVLDVTGYTGDPGEEDRVAQEAYYRASSEFYTKLFLDAAAKQFPIETRLQQLADNGDISLDDVEGDTTLSESTAGEEAINSRDDVVADNTGDNTSDDDDGGDEAEGEGEGAGESEV
jgi:hypothetical protein